MLHGQGCQGCKGCWGSRCRCRCRYPDFLSAKLDFVLKKIMFNMGCKVCWVCVDAGFIRRFKRSVEAVMGFNIGARGCYGIQWLCYGLQVQSGAMAVSTLPRMVVTRLNCLVNTAGTPGCWSIWINLTSGLHKIINFSYFCFFFLYLNVSLKVRTILLFELATRSKIFLFRFLKKDRNMFL